MSRRGRSKNLFSVPTQNIFRSVVLAQDIPVSTIMARTYPVSTLFTPWLAGLSNANVKLLQGIYDNYTRPLSLAQYDAISTDFEECANLLSKLKGFAVFHSSEVSIQLMIYIVEHALLGSLNMAVLVRNNQYAETTLAQLTIQTSDILQAKHRLTSFTAAPTAADTPYTCQQTMTLTPVYNNYLALYGLPEEGVGFDPDKLIFVERLMRLFVQIDPTLMSILFPNETLIFDVSGGAYATLGSITDHVPPSLPGVTLATIHINVATFVVTNTLTGEVIPLPSIPVIEGVSSIYTQAQAATLLQDTHYVTDSVQITFPVAVLNTAIQANVLSAWDNVHRHFIVDDLSVTATQIRTHLGSILSVGLLAQLHTEFSKFVLSCLTQGQDIYQGIGQGTMIGTVQKGFTSVFVPNYQTFSIEEFYEMLTDEQAGLTSQFTMTHISQILAQAVQLNPFGNRTSTMSALNGYVAGNVLYMPEGIKITLTLPIDNRPYTSDTALLVYVVRVPLLIKLVL